MNPEQPGQNNYDFILSPGSPQKASKLGFSSSGGDSGKAARIMVISGIVLVVIVFLIVLSIILNRPNPNTTSMLELAQIQQEIHRIVGIGETATGDQAIKNTSITIQLVIQSNQNQTVAYLKNQKIKINDKQLALKKDVTTDAQLTAAKQSGTYDVVYAQVVKSKLQNYASTLKTAYSSATGTNAKKLLQQEYQDVQLLLKQLTNSAPVTTDEPAS